MFDLHWLQPGTWADWLAAIGTIGAFVVALVLFGVPIRDRRVQQARLVYAMPVGMEAYVSNGKTTTVGQNVWGGITAGTRQVPDIYGDPLHELLENAVEFRTRVGNNSDDLGRAALCRHTFWKQARRIGVRRFRPHRATGRPA